MRRVLAVGVLAALVGGCGPHDTSSPALSDDFARVLVTAAVNQQGPWPRHWVAVRQLRQMAGQRAIGPEILRPLVEHEFEGGYDETGLGLVLACGGPGTDELVFKRFVQPSGPDVIEGWVQMEYILALALAERPSAEATRQLCRLADAEDLAPGRRRLCHLILAARGDRSRDWMACVAADLAAVPEETDSDDRHRYATFVAGLGLAAERLGDASPLVGPLWKLIESDRWESSTAFFALMGLQTAAAARGDVVGVAKLREYIATIPGGENGSSFQHLLLARLGPDCPEHMRKALALLGDDDWGSASCKTPAEVFTMGPMLDEAMVGEIARGLSSADARVRLGALRLAAALDPDPEDMMPRVASLLSDSEAAIRRQAAEAMVTIGGLDEGGRFLALVDPRYEPRVRAALADRSD